MDRIAMVLLTGGNSIRMGTSKAGLVLDGKTFEERIADELAKCGPVYLSVSKDTDPSPLWERFPRVADAAEHIGPMGGISAVFHQTDEDTLFVCACDMPFMSADYVRALCRIMSESDDEPDAVLVRGRGGRLYTTAGIYSRRLLPDIDRRIENGDYRLRDLLAAHSVRYVEEDTLGGLQKALANINTAKEYEGLIKQVQAPTLL